MWWIQILQEQISVICSRNPTATCLNSLVAYFNLGTLGLNQFRQAFGWTRVYQDQKACHLMRGNSIARKTPPRSHHDLSNGFTTKAHSTARSAQDLIKRISSTFEARLWRNNRIFVWVFFPHEHFRKLFSEPFAGIDSIKLYMTKSIARHCPDFWLHIHNNGFHADLRKRRYLRIYFIHYCTKTLASAAISMDISGMICMDFKRIPIRPVQVNHSRDQATYDIPE